MPPRRRLPVSRAALEVIMLPVEILREILKYLDTKLLTRKVFGLWPQWAFGQWAGTQRMRNSARLRRRVGQTGLIDSGTYYRQASGTYFLVI